MKLWLSGEVEAEIGDSFRSVMNEVETLINEGILINYYGDGLIEWDVIFIITKEGGKELFKYSKRKKGTDIRINVDYNGFKDSDFLGKRNKLLDGLIKSLDVLKEMNIKDVDWENLKADLLKYRS